MQKNTPKVGSEAGKCCRSQEPSQEHPECTVIRELRLALPNKPKKDPQVQCLTP